MSRLRVVNGMMTASARPTPFGETELRFPYCEALVDDLNQAIPARYRQWDPEAAS